jgi:hypothetical protein
MSDEKKKHPIRFRGGAHDGRGKELDAEPAAVIVIPVGDGFFERYKRGREEGGAVVYEFSERFEGQR